MLTTVVRPLLRLAIAALLAMSGLVLATTAAASACSCKSDVEVLATRADAVFVANVDGVRKVDAEFEYALTTKHVYKGTVERDTVVTTDQATLDCGLGELKTGTEYLFLVTGTSPPYAATNCDGSAPASAKRLAEIEAVLGAGKDIAEPAPPAPTMTQVEQSAPTPMARLAAPGGALVLIGLLGLLVARRLTRT